MIHVLAADPLLNNVQWPSTIIFVIVKTVVVFGALLTAVLFTIWYERKFISLMQNRYGPQEAGPAGIGQSLADAIKIIFKEALRPTAADTPVFKLAPYLAVIPAFLTFAIIPLGGSITIAHHTTYLQLADPPIGILWLLLTSGVAIYGVMLAGWSSGSKYPLLGSVRASAQLVSYEAALGLSIASVVLVTGSLSTHDIVAAQATRGIGGILPNWNIIQLAFVPFIVFLIAVTAELNRPPFDMTEADSELVGGYMTEYSSWGFACFYLAEFMSMIDMSAIIVTLFLGGPAGPWNPTQPILRWLVPIIYFTVKVLVFISMYVWFRGALPRLRYDQLMDLGWKVLIPIALFWLLVIAAIKVGRWEYAVGMAVAGLLGFLLLTRAIGVGSARADEDRDAEAAARRRLRGR